MPERIQRRRTKGWRMPPNTVYVGRPSKWGNAFLVGPLCPPRLAVINFRNMLNRHDRREIRETLGGKNLACWCPLDRPCHADILLELANGSVSEAEMIERLRAALEGLVASVDSYNEWCLTGRRWPEPAGEKHPLAVAKAVLEASEP